MERNVTSFGVAIRNGFEPGNYTYDIDKIPLGEFEAVLDFKAWSKRIIAINCYFTKTGTGERFVVTVYHNSKSGRFNPVASEVNFGDCAVGRTYYVAVEKNNKEKIILTKAVLQE
jgi:hypothetical protein